MSAGPFILRGGAAQPARDFMFNDRNRSAKPQDDLGDSPALWFILLLPFIALAAFCMDQAHRFRRWQRRRSRNSR